MNTLCRMLGCAWLGAVGIAGAQAPAAEGQAPAAPAGALQIESCVSPDHYTLARGDPWVLLTDAESGTVFEQTVQRYPALMQQGVMPSHIVLWRRPDSAAWIYVLLLADPARTGQMCFTATVVARPLAATAGLLQKYFGERAARWAPAGLPPAAHGSTPVPIHHAELASFHAGPHLNRPALA